MPATTDFEQTNVGTDSGVPETSVDLRRVSFGRDTFSNPFFWIMVGVIGTLALQYALQPKRTT